MGRPAKDGRFVNFLMDTAIFEKLAQVANLTGKTRTYIIEESLKQYIEPFCNAKGEIDAVEAIYVKKRKPCMVLDTITIGDAKYCKILVDGDIETVPVRDVASYSLIHKGD